MAAPTSAPQRANAQANAGMGLQVAHDDLEHLLDELTPREAEVIRSRFGLEDDHPRTLAEIGEAMALSRERVRQIETRALLKLRQPQRRSKVKDYILGLDS